jgi:hypothetical protein
VDEAIAGIRRFSAGSAGLLRLGLTGSAAVRPAGHRLAAAPEIHITDLVQRPAFAAERGGGRFIGV